ncbi:family 10 glycosylhydrolase [Micromonospora cathayae]|uniref:Family 10 glycosylhydrolase n=1 Tax=Micromonospora cathayae TaxID=3028804 RepID=A0ABY7ZXL6_9ACTN|nr:family 10 glycosylhydrolase [Micromonospora sp. HUAS 3]WDZ87832.1 family 10 glycosylhydrolase [Micromonospora sp. HUAS 3]
MNISFMVVSRVPNLVRTVLVAALLVGAVAVAPQASSDPARAGTAPAPVVGPAVACPVDPATPKRQLRAMWIASVANVDWPSRTGLTVAQQQAEYRSWLDLAVGNRMNAVVVQVRPTADALWPSPYEPWSQWLTGTQGRDPGYDPLAFLVAEAHARNLEFHAWFNPYRVANHADPTRLTANHPARVNPGWLESYGGQLYYNPGIPAVRVFVQDAMMDAVRRYDIDGVHWDDYFYPYPVNGVSFPDQDTFAQYGAGFATVADWRRHNVDLLVQEMGQKIHAAKPWVSFGISPFGIWRNAGTDPLGSRTSGLQSYDAIHADTRKWVRQNWIDYVAPQIYWHIGHPAADYAELVRWWSGVTAGTNVQLVVGQATYRAGASGQDPAWQDVTELTDHLTLNRSHPQVVGDIQFSAKDVRANRIGAVARLVADHYRRPALLPVPPARGGSAPGAPTLTAATRGSGGVSLTWQRPATGSTTGYAVYRLPGDGPVDACALADGRHLLATVRATGSTGTYRDATAAAGSTYRYLVTALHRLHHESAPSAALLVPGDGSGTFSVIVDNAGSGFTASAAWGTSTYLTTRYGTNYRFASPQAVSDVAWFSAAIPATGTYRVEVWHPADPGYHSAVPHLVATSTGTVTVNVDQRTGGGQWRTLGSYPLAAGTRQVVGVSRWVAGTGYVVADAVRITRL